MNPPLSDLQRLLEEASIRKAVQEARDNPSAPGSKDLLRALRIAELVLAAGGDITFSMGGEGAGGLGVEARTPGPGREVGEG